MTIRSHRGALLAAAAVALVFSSACSSRSGTASAPLPGAGSAGTPRSAAAITTPPPPLTASEISNGSPRIYRALRGNDTSAPGTATIEGPHRLRQGSSALRRPQNTTSSDNGHGSFVVFLRASDASGAAVTGASATEAVYPGYIYPHTALYAPSLRGPDPDPLEIGVYYLQNLSVVAWVDFTVSSTTIHTPKNLNDPGVQAAYVRTFSAPNGETFRGVTLQTSADAGGVYHAYIFNYSNNGYEELAREATGHYVDGRGGWDIFEYYNGSSGTQCATLPGPVYSTQISLQTAAGWQPADPSNSYAQFTRDTGCFGAPYQAAYYGPDILAANSSWKVSDPPNPRGQTWTQLPGGATDVAGGGDGSIWIIGTSPGPDYGIYYKSGTSSFTQVNGSGVRIAVDSNGDPWVVNSLGEIYQRVGGANGQWQQRPGGATDIGAGGGEVWITGRTTIPGTNDYYAYRWNGSSWDIYQAGGVRIAVDSSGAPWLVNAAGNIYYGPGGAFQQVDGAAVDVGAGGGQVWVIGNQLVGGDHPIYYWTGAIHGTTFVPVEGSGVGIGVGSNGLPIVVNSAGGIYQRFF